MQTISAAPSWLWLTHWGARLVLLILVGLSVASIAVILDRRKLLRAQGDTRALGPAQAAIRSGAWAELKKLADSAGVGVLQGYLVLLTSRLSDAGTVAIDRSTRSYMTDRRAELEKGLTLLATVGSNAPFIGLFGTVLGIIQAFGELSSQQGGTGSVMSAISEALIATAIGLLVAIPAVVAFNVFQKRVREILTPCEILRDEFVARRETPGGR